jgi:hypothetical protein
MDEILNEKLKSFLNIKISLRKKIKLGCDLILYISKIIDNNQDPIIIDSIYSLLTFFHVKSSGDYFKMDDIVIISLFNILNNKTVIDAIFLKSKKFFDDKIKYFLEGITKITDFDIKIIIFKSIIMIMRHSKSIVKFMTNHHIFVSLFLDLFLSENLNLNDKIYFLKVIEDLATDDYTFCKTIKDQFIQKDMPRILIASLINYKDISKYIISPLSYFIDDKFVLIPQEEKIIIHKLIECSYDIEQEFYACNILSNILKTIIIHKKDCTKSASCVSCNNHKKLYICTGCYFMRYCNKECQMKHWHIHKSQCLLLKKL